MAAVYPVQAPHNTSPSYSGAFIPTMWAGKLNAKFYQNTVLSEIANTDYEGEIKNQGDTVRIRTAPTITVSDYTVGQNLNYEVPAPSYVDLQINKGKYFGVAVSDVLEYQADMDLMNMFTEDAGKQMKIQVEDEVFFNSFVTEGPAAANEGATAGALSAGYNLGTDVTPIDQATAANVLNCILRMASVMDEQNLPDERILLISPYDRHLLMQSNIAQRTSPATPVPPSAPARSACWTGSPSTSATCCRARPPARPSCPVCPTPPPVVPWLRPRLGV